MPNTSSVIFNDCERKFKTRDIFSICNSKSKMYFVLATTLHVFQFGWWFYRIWIRSKLKIICMLELKICPKLGVCMFSFSFSFLRVDSLTASNRLIVIPNEFRCIYFENGENNASTRISSIDKNKTFLRFWVQQISHEEWSVYVNPNVHEHEIIRQRQS